MKLTVVNRSRTMLGLPAPVGNVKANSTIVVDITTNEIEQITALLVDYRKKKLISFVVESDEVVLAPPSTVYYEHTQSPAASTWVINHNLGFRPIVCVRVGGMVVDVETLHFSTNQVRVYFAAPYAGVAHCS